MRKPYLENFLVFLVLFGTVGQAAGKGGAHRIRIFTNNPGAALGANYQAHYQQSIQSKAADDREGNEGHSKKKIHRFPINPELRKGHSLQPSELDRTISGKNKPSHSSKESQ